jgi:hypothetical protein
LCVRGIIDFLAIFDEGDRLLLSRRTYAVREPRALGTYATANDDPVTGL